MLMFVLDVEQQKDEDESSQSFTARIVRMLQNQKTKHHWNSKIWQIKTVIDFSFLDRTLCFYGSDGHILHIFLEAQNDDKAKNSTEKYDAILLMEEKVLKFLT